MEIGIRFSGLIDFPLYEVDDGIGYMIRPSQSGAFLGSHTWVFNDRSMGTAIPWDPGKKPNLLLIGNSIVMGGNPYAQPDKLGPLVQNNLGGKVSVWPIAVGGWTEVNETAYLERNPDVASSSSFFVWVAMSGGLGKLSSWRGDYVFPRQRPWLATWYALRRYVLPRILHFEMSDLPPKGNRNAAYVSRFEAAIATMSRASNRTVPGIVVFYPTKPELDLASRGQEWLDDRQELERIAGKYGALTLDLSQQAGWANATYRDGTHPTVEANKILAKIIADAVHGSFSVNK